MTSNKSDEKWFTEEDIKKHLESLSEKDCKKFLGKAFSAQESKNIPDKEKH